MEAKGVLAEGEITNPILEDWQNRIGMDLRVSNIFNQYVSQESIRNYANGVGDNNPLYRDLEYAKKTRYGKLVAPPNWLYSVFPTWVLQGLPGVHAFHSGNDWVFYRPIFMGDTITPKCEFVGYDVKPSKFAKRTGFEYQRSDFYNQHDQLVARTYLWLIRAERQTARKMGKYADIQLPHPYSEEEMDKIDDEVMNEKITGANTIFWDDVQVGDELYPLTKGPFGLTDMIAYCVGAAPVVISAHSTQLMLYKKHPAWGFRDPDTGAWEPVYGVHYNKAAANSAGLPYPYDVGAQRQSWLINFLCNWVGDEGWLKKNYAEYRQFVYLSDTIRFTGKVVKKYVDDEDEYCVDLETSAMNQRGQEVMPGFATVALPNREKGYWPLEARLR